jgi:hypothetical protein
MLLPNGPSIWPTRPIASAVLCENNVWHQGPKEIAPGVSVLCAVSCLPLLRCLLSASRSCSDRSGSRGCGWSSASPHLDDPLAPAICRGACTYGNVEGRFSSPSPTACRALASSLELARPARTQCLVGTTATACYHRWRSRSSRHQLAKEESAT